MGFDAVDRRYRKPEPIKLECARCGSTDRVEMSCSVACFNHSTGALELTFPSVPLCRAHQRDNSNATPHRMGLLTPTEISGHAGWLES